VALLCAGLTPSQPTPLFAQGAEPAAEDAQIQAKLDSLAERLAKTLEEKHATKVIVFDLLGPQGLRAPFGSWLAGQISSRLAKQHLSLQVIERDSIRPLLNQRNEEAEQALRAEGEQEASAVDGRFSKQAGADAWVFGRYSKLATGIGITLGASDGVAGHNSSEFTSLFPLVPQASAMLPPDLAEYVPMDGVYDADVGGVSSPLCLECTPPLYDDESRRAKCGGTVVLKVVVTAQGTPRDVTAFRGIPGCSRLTDAAKEAVSKWRFEPAHGSSDEVVAVRVPVEVAFSLSTEKSACIKCRAFKMDSASRKNHCHGIVGVEFTVTPTGHATDISVTQEVSGCPGLTKSVVDAVSKSVFRNGPDSEGRPLPARRSMQVTFQPN
jgi:TonB family protein